MTISEKPYADKVKLAARVAVIVAMVQLLIKAYAWYVTQSSAVLASATDSMLDMFSSTVSLFVISIATRPADKEHAFGHGKAESVGGLCQSAFILGSAILLLVHGVEKLLNPQPINDAWIGIFLTFITLVLTLGLVIYQRKVIQQTGSLAIEADSLHYQSDVLLNVGVLVALALMTYQIYWIDGVFTIIVSALLALGAVKVTRKSLSQLLDEQFDENEINVLTQIVLSNKDVFGVHDVKTRKAGHQCFIQLHLELDAHQSLDSAHQIGEDVEQALLVRFENAEIIIHHDPVNRKN